MGRSKKITPPAAPSKPAYTSTALNVEDFGTANTLKKGNSTVNEYVPSEMESFMNALAGGKASEAMIDLNSNDKQMANYYADMENVYVNDALNKLYTEYDNSYSALKEDVASRFGSLNSSQFLNALNGLEQAKMEGTTDIINQGKMYSNQLAQADQVQLLNTISALTSVLNNNYNNALNAISLQNQINNDSASIANSVYQTQMGNYTSQLNNVNNNYTNLANAFLNSGNSVFNTILKKYLPSS